MLFMLQENEPVFHCEVQCPILRRIRWLWPGRMDLSYEEFVSYLNGRDWRSLYHCLRDAWHYRRKLNSESDFKKSKLL